MARVVYVVARDQSLVRGYLMTKVGARSPEGHPVEIKVDERRGERRQQEGPRDPERRRGERRLQPSLDSELRSRGYARVVQFETSKPQVEQRTVQPAIGWRPRSTWRQGVAASRSAGLGHPHGDLEKNPASARGGAAHRAGGRDSLALAGADSHTRSRPPKRPLGSRSPARMGHDLTLVAARGASSEAAPPAVTPRGADGQAP